MLLVSGMQKEGRLKQEMPDTKKARYPHSSEKVHGTDILRIRVLIFSGLLLAAQHLLVLGLSFLHLKNEYKQYAP